MGEFWSFQDGLGLFFGLEVCVEGELVVLATRHDAGLLVVSDPGERKLKRGKLDLNRPRS